MEEVMQELNDKSQGAGLSASGYGRLLIEKKDKKRRGEVA